MKRAIILAILAAGMGAAVITCKGGEGSAPRPAATPPIDGTAHETTETAIFALG